MKNVFTPAATFNSDRTGFVCKAWSDDWLTNYR